jgi:hypothetical protein
MTFNADCDLRPTAALDLSPLPGSALNGERARVRGGRLHGSLLPPLTLTLSPFALSSAMGRGDAAEHVVSTRGAA